MSESKVISLRSIRTDGWFDRVADSVSSFDLLCEILGEPFVAFALITGVRVTALTVDRQNPGQTLVDFETEPGDGAGGVQRLTLEDFRLRLANALTTQEPTGQKPERETDVAAIQRHIGVRYLLLAPLFGYRLEELRCDAGGSSLVVHHDGDVVEFELDDFQQLLRSHVMQELYRAEAATAERRGGLDLSLLPRAEEAAAEGRHLEVVELLGSWLVPLTILLRTPDGQALDSGTRSTLSSALGLVGTSLTTLGESEQGHAALRLAVQYALDTPSAGVAYASLGRALMSEKRFGEAIAALRRSANLGGAAEVVWPALAHAFLECGRLLAALGAVEEGTQRLGSSEEFSELRRRVFERLPELETWQALVYPKQSVAS